MKFICKSCKTEYPCVLDIGNIELPPESFACPKKIEKDDCKWEKFTKLTAEVFYRPDCPEWAKYAAVDKDGRAWYFESKPSCSTDQFFEFRNKATMIPGFFDSDDWRNSLIERPSKLPDWCKVGEWVWDERNGYGEIKSVRDDRSACNIEFKGGGGDFVPEAFAKLKEARLMNYDHQSIAEALGKVVSNDSAVGLVTGYDIATVRVFGKFIPFNVFRQMFRYLDGSPCAILEHLEDGEWVK